MEDIRIRFHFDFLDLGDNRGSWSPKLQCSFPLFQSPMPNLYQLNTQMPQEDI